MMTFVEMYYQNTLVFGEFFFVILFLFLGVFVNRTVDSY